MVNGVVRPGHSQSFQKLRAPGRLMVLGDGGTGFIETGVGEVSV